MFDFTLGFNTPVNTMMAVSDNLQKGMKDYTEIPLQIPPHKPATGGARLLPF